MAAAGGLALATARAGQGGADARAKRGEYLVRIGGCNDCHTPLKMGSRGPEPDLARMLSGHPEQLVMTAAPPVTGPWAAVASATMTAWAGPWGTSFSANLTPDPETGLGRWTEANFVDAMRSGRHMGRGRPILPPMPVASLAAMTDDDLGAVFGYLRTVPSARNRVPDPLPPIAAR